MKNSSLTLKKALALVGIIIFGIISAFLIYIAFNAITAAGIIGGIVLLVALIPLGLLGVCVAVYRSGPRQLDPKASSEKTQTNKGILTGSLVLLVIGVIAAAFVGFAVYIIMTLIASL